MILAVLTAVLLIVFVLRLARTPGARVNLGDQEFAVGRATVFAPVVAAHGPLIFAPLRGSITLYVQHLGTDPAKGWLAFGAHDSGQATKCVVKWRPSTRDFLDPCNQAVYPEDGRGLDQYATRVDPSGQIIINLRQPVPPTTTAPERSTTSAPANP